MSTIKPYIVQCAVCGKKSNHTKITSYSNFGYPDLDFRPPSMFRETMNYWIQECPYCGYVNARIDEPCDLSTEMILSIYKEIESCYDWKKSYKIAVGLAKALLIFREPDDDGDIDLFLKPRWLDSHTNDETAALRFSKLGAMHAKLTDYHNAAGQFLRSAWVFDDNENETEATNWRKAAIEQVELMMCRRQTQVTEEIICVYADMLRRVGDFQSVSKLLDAYQLHDIATQLIKYQKELSEHGDRETHTIDEVGATIAEKYHSGMFFSNLF